MHHLSPFSARSVSGSLFALTLATLVLAGCAVSDTTTSDRTADAASGDVSASPDAATPDAPTPDAGACNLLPLEGAAITLTTVLGAPPAPSGGTIADGRYRLTAFAVFYPSAPAPPVTALSASIDITGSTMQSAGRSTPQVFNNTAAFTAAGTSLTLNYTCPSGLATSTAQYSASSTQLVLSFAQGALTLVQTYTRM